MKIFNADQARKITEKSRKKECKNAIKNLGKMIKTRTSQGVPYVLDSLYLREEEANIVCEYFRKLGYQVKYRSDMETIEISWDIPNNPPDTDL